MKVAILEDDIIIAENLKQIIEAEGYEVLCSFDSAEEFLSFNDQFDLLLVDINLEGDMDGIDLVNKLSGTGLHFSYIFISDIDDYRRINRALSTEPLSYLSKPFKKKDIQIALKLAAKKTSSNNEDQLRAEGDVIYIKDKDKLISLLKSDILFVEAQGSYSEINTVDRKVLVSQNLSKIEKKSSLEFLMRIHKSFLVNPSMISEIRQRSSVLIKDRELSIGDSYKQSFLETLDIL